MNRDNNNYEILWWKSSDFKEETMSKLGDYLKTLRKNKGFSLREAEELLGVSRTFICDLENGAPFPSGNKKGEKTNLVQKYVEVYELAPKEAENFKLMVDESLLNKASSNISADVVEYLKSNQVVQQVLRKAIESDLSEEEWNKFLERIKNK